MASAIRGILFDKDGTLFDFEATWSAWSRSMLIDLAEGDLTHAARLGDLIGYNLATQVFQPDSVVIAGTPDDIVRQLLPGVPDIAPDVLADRLNAAAALAHQAEAVPLAPLLAELRAMGLVLGVATNDAESPARAHLAAAGQEAAFAFIAGYDSGFGGKPHPGMCLGFARAVGLEPASILMVGDSRHDLVAGRAAGMRCVAVLTGMAGAAELAPLADAVLPDIGHLPACIVAANGARS